MKKLLASLGLVAALALIALPSAAAAQAADAYGVGGGKSVNFAGGKGFKFAFSAHTTPQGDFGSLRFTIEPPFAPVDVHVDVDCVNIFPIPPGAGGWIGGPITKVAPEPNSYGLQPGDQMLAGFNDFGNPSSDPSDQFTPGFFNGPSQQCKLFPPSYDIGPIDQGNIVVKIG